MNITATYNAPPVQPPPPPEGTVTITLPVSIAAKVVALIGVTNGSSQTGIGSSAVVYDTIKRAIPEEMRLNLVKADGSEFTFDLNESYRFVADHKWGK